MESNTHFSSSVLIKKAIKTISKEKVKTDLPSYQLRREIDSSLKELMETRQYFEYVEEADLVDYAIYREKAIITKLSYLFKKAKQII